MCSVVAILFIVPLPSNVPRLSSNMSQYDSEQYKDIRITINDKSRDVIKADKLRGSQAFKDFKNIQILNTERQKM